ncbi:MAG: hypothetical protein LBQ37_00310 [Elusimicrobiota bacterium]|jgi:hypothetical protein|nr:hypothetical protein [Elusimicrobiota bacterium]
MAYCAYTGHPAAITILDYSIFDMHSKISLPRLSITFAVRLKAAILAFNNDDS